MWPEVETAKKENRHELKLSGAVVKQRFESNNGKLDETIFQLANLNLLDIHDSPLQQISPKIENLHHLQSLLLFRNRISEVPVAIGSLNELKVLDLSWNAIVSLPEHVCSLKTLTTLNVSYNKLKSVGSLSKLENLIVCDLSGNELEEWPEFYTGETQRLSELNLEKNRITEIPETLPVLSALKNLNVAENQIKQVPRTLAKCSKLKEVNLKCNPLKDPRLKKLVEQCRSKQVLDYVEKNGSVATKGASCVTSEPDSVVSETPETPVETKETIRHKITVRKCTAQSPKILISPEAKAVRPHVIMCIVRNFPLTNMKKFLQIQNELHDNECGRREFATIATHDLAKVKGNVRMDAAPPDTIEITVLGASAKVTATKYYDGLRQQAESIRKEKKRNTYSGVHKFIRLLESAELFAFLADDEKVISLPPLTNCNETKISATTRDILIEVTGAINHECCQKIMVTLIQRMLLMEVDVTRSTVLVASKKKAKGKGETSGGATVTGYSCASEMLVEQVQLCDVDGTFRSVFPGKPDLHFDDQERIDVVFE